MNEKRVNQDDRSGCDTREHHLDPDSPASDSTADLAAPAHCERTRLDFSNYSPGEYDLLHSDGVNVRSIDGGKLSIVCKNSVNHAYFQRGIVIAFPRQVHEVSIEFSLKKGEVLVAAWDDGNQMTKLSESSPATYTHLKALALLGGDGTASISAVEYRSYYVRIDRVTQGPDGMETPADRLTIDSEDFLWLYVAAELPVGSAVSGEYFTIIDGKVDPATRVLLGPPKEVNDEFRFAVSHYTLSKQSEYLFHFADDLNDPTHEDQWEIMTL